MATLLSFHAHPDDESIGTGGTIAKAVADGHRAVLVFGTGGEEGEVAEGFLAEGETLGERRRQETLASAEVLGVSRVEFLGYRDSGMIDTPTNANPECFWQADVEEAAERLAAILRDEGVDVLTIYDDHGGYGHPDHIQVHRVGVRAAELAGTPVVLEGTMNRDAIRTFMEFAKAQAEAAGEPFEGPGDDDFDDNFGSSDDQITTAVDVSAYVMQKKASMRAHASQIGEESFFLAMPDEAFAVAFATEWFIRRGAPEGTKEDSIFAALG